MSLVLGVAYKDFVIVSNDSRVTKQLMDPVTLELYGDMVVTDLKHEKIDRITDKVFLTTTGWSSCGDLFKTELYKRVNKSNDLKECSAIAGKLFSELKAGIVKGLSDQEQKAARLLESRNFATYMLGFNHSGTTGLKDIVFGSYTETSLGENKGYPALINGPEHEYDFQFKKVLSLPKNERTIDSFMKRLAVVHANLSHYHKIQVSPDCNFHILQKEGNSIGYIKKTVDTLPFYEQLGLKVESQ